MLHLRLNVWWVKSRR
ncbi:hypothetical protein GZH46_01171 [Fragariocoptes setiger]|uniref:Uncharacterized protein n=1 Tax=Fragariocoptes setiger TaxID=1670756 RepID=A0ABQ7SA43_9ACAR|nr:hypothetical protein GZH46_01171 [Fragariocoptes setiger]